MSDKLVRICNRYENSNGALDHCDLKPGEILIHDTNDEYRGIYVGNADGGYSKFAAPISVYTFDESESGEHQYYDTYIAKHNQYICLLYSDGFIPCFSTLSCKKNARFELIPILDANYTKSQYGSIDISINDISDIPDCCECEFMFPTGNSPLTPSGDLLVSLDDNGYIVFSQSIEIILIPYN